MSSNNKNPVDLEGTSYDSLETDLTQFMGLKVFMVRGWSNAGKFNQAQANMAFAKTQEAWEAARDQYERAKQDMLESLRANILRRDALLGIPLSHEDLYSLQSVGHVTVRKGNTSPEEAVIIFDPVSTPAKSVATMGFSDASGKQQTVNFVETSGVSAASKDAALEWAFGKAFDSWWEPRFEDRMGAVRVADNVENFDIDIDDIRRYEALKRVRYALLNQTELETSDRHPNATPEYMRFASLNRRASGIDTPDSKLRYVDVLDRVETEKYYGAEELGMKDKDFFDKLKKIEAVKSLVSLHSKPTSTFARIGYSGVSDEMVMQTQTSLYKRVKAKMAEKNPKGSSFGLDEDWRILFPAFREVYEEDKSEGLERRYLDTIMEGLQTYFPTLTNAQLPAQFDREKEPPRALQTPQAAPQPKKPGASPLKPSA